MTHRRREDADRDVREEARRLFEQLDDAEPVDPSEDDVGEGWE